MENNFYIYYHYDLNGKPFYIGYGSMINKNGINIGYKRAKEKHKLHKSWMEFITNNNIKWNFNCIKNNLCKIVIESKNLDEIIDLEIEHINKYGLQNLVNKRNGGAGRKYDKIIPLIEEEIKLKRKEYNSRANKIQWRKEYLQRPEIKEKYRLRQEERRKQKEYRDKFREYQKNYRKK